MEPAWVMALASRPPWVRGPSSVYPAGLVFVGLWSLDADSGYTFDDFTVGGP